MPVILNQPLAVLRLPSSGLVALSTLDSGPEFHSLVDAPQSAKTPLTQTEPLDADQPEMATQIAIKVVADAAPDARMPLVYWDQGPSADRVIIDTSHEGLAETKEPADPKDDLPTQPFIIPTQAQTADIPMRTDLALPALQFASGPETLMLKPTTSALSPSDNVSALRTENPGDQATKPALGRLSDLPVKHGSKPEFQMTVVPLQDAPKIIAPPISKQGVSQDIPQRDSSKLPEHANPVGPGLGPETAKRDTVVDGKTGVVIDLPTGRGIAPALPRSPLQNLAEHTSVTALPKEAPGPKVPSAIPYPTVSNLAPVGPTIQMSAQPIARQSVQNMSPPTPTPTPTPSSPSPPQLSPLPSALPQNQETIDQTVVVPMNISSSVSVPESLARIVEQPVSVKITRDSGSVRNDDRNPDVVALTPVRQTYDLTTLQPIGPMFESALAATSPPDATQITTGDVGASFDVDPLPRDLTRAHHVASQISAEIRTLGVGHPTEITLSPEELGKVKLVLHTADDGLRLQIIAERPETADLMRRHIDTLAQEFRDIGFKSLSFDFAGQRQDRPAQQGQPDTGSQREGAQHRQNGPELQHHNTNQQPAETARWLSGSSLDLRL